MVALMGCDISWPSISFAPPVMGELQMSYKVFKITPRDGGLRAVDPYKGSALSNPAMRLSPQPTALFNPLTCFQARAEGGGGATTRSMSGFLFFTLAGVATFYVEVLVRTFFHL